MKPGRVYYHHVRHSNGTAITFAVRLREDGWVEFSYALATRKEKFRKDKGRLIAAGRLNCQRPNFIRRSGFLRDPEEGLHLVMLKVEAHFWESVLKRMDWANGHLKWLYRWAEQWMDMKDNYVQLSPPSKSMLMSANSVIESMIP